MATISNAVAVAALNAGLDLLDVGGAGKLRIYDGTPPARPDAALSGNTLLAELNLSATGFANAVDNTDKATATANAITSAVAIATGTASFARLTNNAGTAHVQLTLTATGGGGELQVATVSFVSGVTVSVTSLTISQLE